MSYYKFPVICLLTLILASCQNKDSTTADSTATAQSLCSEGYYLDHGQCLPVGPGYQSSKDGISRQACGPGTYSAIATASECSPCSPPLHTKSLVFSSRDSALTSDSCGIDELSCDDGFAAEGKVCYPVTYTATWDAPGNTLLPCQGRQVIARNMRECLKHYGNTVESVAVSQCSGLTIPEETLLSPAGSQSEETSHGTITRTCPEGTSEPTTTTLACFAGYYLNGLACEAVGPGYYAPAGANQRIRCPAGTYSEIATAAACSPCSNLGPHISKATYSSLDSGLTTNSCRYAFITCEPGYAKDANSMACFEETYTALWSAPADPGLDACAGSKTLSATLQGCVRTFMGKSAPVSNSYCYKAPPPTTTFLSPQGTRAQNIPGGQILTECAVGATTGPVQRQCFEKYTDTGSACLETCNLPDPPPGTHCLDGTISLGHYNGTRFKTTPSGCNNGPLGCSGNSDNQVVSLNNSTATNSICSGKVAFAASNWTIPSLALLKIMMTNADQLGGLSSETSYLAFELESCGALHKSVEANGLPRANEACLSGTALVRCVRSY